VWNFEKTIAQTVGWYHECLTGHADAHALTARQIAEYATAAKTMGLPWA